MGKIGRAASPRGGFADAMRPRLTFRMIGCYDTDVPREVMIHLDLAAHLCQFWSSVALPPLPVCLLHRGGSGSPCVPCPLVGSGTAIRLGRLRNPPISLG